MSEVFFFGGTLLLRELRDAWLWVDESQVMPRREKSLSVGGEGLERASEEEEDQGKFVCQDAEPWGQIFKGQRVPTGKQEGDRK